MRSLTSRILAALFGLCLVAPAGATQDRRPPGGQQRPANGQDKLATFFKTDTTSTPW